MAKINTFMILLYHHYHHHQSINVSIAGAQAFLMDYKFIRRTGHNPPRVVGGWPPLSSFPY
jgi:hypothetical protein